MSNSNEKNIIEAQKVFGDCLLMLLVPSIISVKIYGARALAVIAVSVFVAAICDFVGSILINKEYYSSDLSSICAGIMIALMMPSGIALYIPAIASSFAVLVAKIPFGGGVKTSFVPAAAGFAFSVVCFPEQIFSYENAGDFMSSTSIASLLMSGKSLKLNLVNIIDIFCGNVVGPLGTGCLLVLIACCVFLLIRRRETLISTASFLVACAIFAAVFPRSNAGILTNIFLELSSGSIMFAAVFLITYYSTLPKNNTNKILYGIACGIICMVMRRLGKYEEPVCFAILVGNAISPLLDLLAVRIRIIRRSVKRRKGGVKQ